jgi:hypothetical protein
MLVLDSFKAGDTLHPFDMFGLGEAAWKDRHQNAGEEASCCLESQ